MASDDKNIVLLTLIWYNGRLLREIPSTPFYPLPITIYGTVAQWLEQASYKRQVGSSILPSPTIMKSDKKKTTNWQLERENYLHRHTMSTVQDEKYTDVKVALTFLFSMYAIVAIYEWLG